MKKEKGVIISYLLIFGFIFLLLLAALLGFILQQLKTLQQRIAWHQALNIAEAGIEYYKWCLNNNVENCSLEKEYSDLSGKTIGKFKIELTSELMCQRKISQKIISTGWTNKFPNIKRKIASYYLRDSVAKYAFLLNTNVWVGADHIIYGPFHSNGGIRFDGKNLSSVFSAKENWICTSSFGCGPNGVGYGFGLCPPECQIVNNQCQCPGIFSTTQNSTRDLFSFPIPPFDFNAISVDLSQIKNLTKNENLGLYFGPSGAFGYRVLIEKENLKVWKVTEVNWLRDICTLVNEKIICDNDPCQPECPECQGGKCVVKEPVIKNEILIFDGQISPSCQLLFFEDNLWVGLYNQENKIKGKMTIASADLENPNKKTTVWIQGNIDYTNYDGSDGFLLISQGNNLISLYSPDQMKIRGIFVAQKGFFGRNHYPCSKYSPWCERESLEITGSIVSAGRVGTQWIQTPGGQIISGYRKRNTFVDRNLLQAPPLFTPFLSSQFKISGWEEF